MGVVAELILIRHGQSASNVAFPRADAAGLVDSGLAGRDHEVELTELGQQQAAALGGWFTSTDRPHVVITSPYRRAAETWRIAAETAGLDQPAPTTDDRLVDRLLGDLEMLTRAAVAQRFPDEPGRASQAGEYHYRPPGGGNFSDIAERLTSFLADLNADHAGKRVVVVAHDSIVLMMRAVIEDLDLAAVAEVAGTGYVRNASITRFDGTSGELRLHTYNATDHLPPS